MIKKTVIIGCLLTFGCATMQSRPIVYPDGNHNSAQYRQDLAMCESWSEGAAYEGTASVADGAVTGGLAGALLGAALGAALSAAIGFDPGIGAMVGTTAGGIQGLAGGAAYSAAEREHRRKEAVLLCLKKNGYDAAY